jgi:predicted CopG family antitoxin
MPAKKIYNESKRRFTMTLTQTAIEWLEAMKEDIGANSLSDVVERLARQNVDKR